MDSTLSPHCRIYVPVERRGKYGSPYTWLACNIGRTKFAADAHQQAATDYQSIQLEMSC